MWLAPQSFNFALTSNPVQVTLQAGKAIRCGGFVFPAGKNEEPRMGCGQPSPALAREDGLRPTVPSARDLSVPRPKVERVLQELYVPLTPALRRRLDTRLRGGRADAVGSSSF